MFIPTEDVLTTAVKSPGPSCSKLGYDDPGLVRDLNSDLKA